MYRLAIIGESQAQLTNTTLREWLTRAGFKVSSGWGPKIPEEDVCFLTLDSYLNNTEQGTLVSEQMTATHTKPLGSSVPSPSLPTPLMTLGETVVESLTSYRLPIHKIRGSILPMTRGGWLVATMDPSDVGPSKGQDELKPHLGGDARRAIETLAPRVPRVSFLQSPTKLSVLPQPGDIVSVDIEGANGRPNIVGVSWEEDQAWVFPWSEELRLWLTSLFETCVPTFHNASFDIPELEEAGVVPPRQWWDTIVMAALYDPSQPKNLQTQVLTHVPGSATWKRLIDHEKGPNFSSGQVAVYRGLWDDILRRMGRGTHGTGQEWYQFYNGLDTTWGLALANNLKRKLEAQGRWNYYTDILMPLQRPLLEMGQQGMPLDMERLLAHQANCQQWKAEAASVLVVAADAAGIHRPDKRKKPRPPEPINIDSPKQLAMLLYDNYGLPVVKTAGGGRAVNEDAIIDLTSRVTRGTAKVKGDKDECLKVLEAVTAYNHWGHWLDTFLNPPIGHRGDGSYLLTAYSLHRTTTGRLSSGLDTSDLDKSAKKVRKAQVQNIPKELRDMIAPPKGYIVVGGDWSGFQLALFLYFAEQVEQSGFHLDLLEQMWAGTFDPHGFLACTAYDLPRGSITKGDERRQLCKPYTFELLFEGTGRTTARKAGHPDKIGVMMFNAHEVAFRKVKWRDALMAEVKKRHYVQTPLGWRRYFWSWTPKASEVTATKIQATEADVFKWVKRRANETKKSNWHWLTDTHDFLSLWVPQEEEIAASTWLKDQMQQPIPWLDNRQWRADVRQGRTWKDVS